MRKAIIIFTSILIGIFVLLSMLDSRGDYVAERIIWRASQEFNKIAKSPENVPDLEYERVASLYKKVIDGFPSSKLTPGTYLLLGQTYATKKDYDAARQTFRQVRSKYPADVTLLAQASFMIAKSYELEDNWTQALKDYGRIMEDYSLTDIGLSVPLRIASYYRNNEQPRAANAAYRKAISHYKKLADENSDPKNDFKLLSLLSNTYIITQRWNEALDVNKEILMKYPFPQIAGQIIKNINMIALTQLENPDAAITLYNDILSQKPEHPAKKIFSEVIDSLIVIKESDVKVKLEKK